VYGSQAKLQIDPEKVTISRYDFEAALRRITPSSHRSACIHARPLPPAAHALLLPTLETLEKQLREQLPLSFRQRNDGTSRTLPSPNTRTRGAGESDVLLCDWESPTELQLVYGMMNDDNCRRCGKLGGDPEGDLILCEACPAVYHMCCLPSACPAPDLTSDEPWFCGAACIAKGKAKSGSAENIENLSTELPPLPLGAFQPDWSLHRPRLLLHGPPGMGQSLLAAGL
jgi:hypothetical protein